MATHVKVIGGLFLVVGGCFIVGAFFAPLLFTLLAGIVHESGDRDAAVASTILGFTGVALTAMLLIFAIPFIATGWGLLKFRSWARIAGIILGAMCLINIPFGTIIGIYALVVLFRKDTEALFT